MIKKKILNAVDKLELDLSGHRVLTEAATGNYVVSPVLSALAGAQVTALTRHSAYGTVSDVVEQTMTLARHFGVQDKIEIVTDVSDLPLDQFDVVTNCGFLRPLDEMFILKLLPTCVIPLMYEPWEFRSSDLDIEACVAKGLKVYGTNEADPRLKIMEYIGYIALHFLLEKKRSPFSTNVLVLGCDKFVQPIAAVLKKNGYSFTVLNQYEMGVDVSGYDSVVIADLSDSRMLIGRGQDALIQVDDIDPSVFVLHIAGTVDFTGAGFSYVPESPRPFGYMSYTTDFIDSQAVVDLHAAGLNVAQGMLEANRLGLKGEASRDYIEANFPALAFNDAGLW